jgi:glycosyltransferase involved in cell wall biosynthesis
MSPFFSVCIPNYNNGEYLKAALQSCLDQDFPNFEVVVVDNRSDDNSINVVRAIRDSRVRLFINDSNIGMYPNINKTIAHARGQYIKILCADDILERRCLSVFARAIKMNPNVDFFGGRIKDFSDDMIPPEVSSDALVSGFLLTSENLGAFLHDRSSWGGGLLSHCFNRTALLNRFGGYFTRGANSDFSADVRTFYLWAARYSAFMIDTTIAFQRIHSSQSRFSFNNMPQLSEYLLLEKELMLECTKQVGLKVPLDVIVVRHLFRGMRLLCRARPQYIYQTFKELVRHKYARFPFGRISQVAFRPNPKDTSIF